jgi:hypothetical protein
MCRDAAPENSRWIPPKAVAEWLTLTHVLEEVGAVACQTTDPDVWWPDRKRPHSPPTSTAVAACRACPAAEPCLAYAVAADERFGIWGGTTPEDRRAMRWATGPS